MLLLLVDRVGETDRYVRRVVAPDVTFPGIAPVLGERQFEFVLGQIPAARKQKLAGAISWAGRMQVSSQIGKNVSCWND